MKSFSPKECCHKAISFLLVLAFLAESTLAPVLLSLPQTASAQTVSTTWNQTSSGGHISQKLHYAQSSNSFYGIGSDNAVWKWNNSTKQWSRVTDGSIKDDFHFISESDIYGIGLDNQIWHWNGIRWNQESEKGKIQQKIWYVDGNHVYGIGMDNQVWRWGSAGGWVQITSNGQVKDDFHFISESDIYGIGLDNQIWKWGAPSVSGVSQPVAVAPGQIASRLHVVSSTLMYGIGLDNKIWKWSDIAGWSPIAPGGQVKDDFTLVNNSENNIYGIGLDNNVWHWNGVSWGRVTMLPGQIASRLHVVSSTLMYGIGLDNKIWKWSDIAGWSPIAPGGQVKDDFTLVNNSENNIYGIGLDNNVWHWNGTNWQSKSSGASISQIVPPVGVTPTFSRPAPTPTTTPMATLTLQRDQEQVLPDQPVSFSGTLDSSRVAFPQGTSFFIAIPEKTDLKRLEVDGRILGTNEFSLGDGTVKIPFAQSWYNNSHSFRVVLRNTVSPVPQLDRRVAVWITVVDANKKLLLKGRTASTLVAHLPTEVIGKGVSLSLKSGQGCCWVSADTTHFPIREFSFSEMDITRGPFFTPNQVPLLPENIAFTLFPSDALMQEVGMSLKQFSDPLAKEFITAQYQYILGRDPSNEELLRYLPKFIGWRNPLANLMEVYNRRADVRQAVMVQRDRNIGGKNDGSPRPSWDKLLEWVAAYGWKEEPSLASFKPQTGFDNGWQLFQELWTKYAPLVSLDSLYGEQWSDRFEVDARNNPVSAIAYLCYTSNMNHKGSQQDRKTSIDFEFCWKNDPMVRHAAILWAKDTGWAYNNFVLNPDATCATESSCSYPLLATINPSGPILASVFGPGKYPEYAEEQQWRYPPAQLYYDLISSAEYASSIQQRFRTNIDSIYRLFFSRPASEDDIAWAKERFIAGGYKNPLAYSRWYSWITPQWEPNGILIASNFQYMEEIEFVKNPRYITDDVYGIRNIQGEADAVSSRLVEMIEKYGRQELYQGDNFKRIVSGLYRLYLRRTPTDAEVEGWRASGKNFGKIEFDINQSREYGKNPASDDAIKNIYRNYLGRDPNDVDIAQWGDKTISSIAQSIGTSAEMKSLAQQHPENAYIFPIKKIKIVKCGFFCSIAKMIKTVIMRFTVAQIINAAVNPLKDRPGVERIMSLMEIILKSLSYGFDQAGFNGKTFVQDISIARSMAGQAGGVFNLMNVLENADSTILEGFRTMARAPQAPQGNAFAQAIQQTYPGLASPLTAIAGLFGAKQEVSTGRIAQIEISSHYGSGAVAPSKGTSSAKGSAETAGTTKASFTKTLAQGSRGAEVLKLQKLLGELDLAFLPEYQTGYYGAKTAAAVKRFQKRNGLEQVGFVGVKTRALLNSAR